MTTPPTTIPQMNINTEEITDIQDIGKLFIVVLL